jgi:hypothetical protein
VTGHLAFQLGDFQIATESQRLFNRTYSENRYRPDVWRNLSKEEKRLEGLALLTNFIWSGGNITYAVKPSPKGKGRHLNFQTDEKSGSYSRDVTRYLRGDNLGAKSRFTSRPIKDDAATKRDAVKRAGVAHTDFSGGVARIGDRLVPRQAGSKIVWEEKDPTGVLIEPKANNRDSADGLVDAARRATVRDDFNMMAIDHEHLAAFKLAA